jgi:hypothetical protein
MMQWGNRNMDAMRKRYPTGTRLELISMEGEADMPPGLRGAVQYVDDAGQIGMAWDNNHSLSLIPGQDSFRILTPEEIAGEQAETTEGMVMGEPDIGVPSLISQFGKERRA